MVESTYLLKGDDLSELLPVHEPRLGRIFLEGKVRPGAIGVPAVVRKDSAEMPLVEDDNVFQTLSAQRSKESLRVGVLPRGARGNRHLMEAESCSSSA